MNLFSFCVYASAQLISMWKGWIEIEANFAAVEVRAGSQLS
jgi:hypothetical protein